VKIAINGAGIAGPTLAYWLRRSGHEVLLIEESPQLRKGGYAIDFWGVGYDIAEKMGLLPKIKASNTSCRTRECNPSAPITRSSAGRSRQRSSLGLSRRGLRSASLSATL
jgi:2-polyprenyl-6-methoxyphenol hydroxylase-like FAD-dependent oxidoreductase